MIMRKIPSAGIGWSVTDIVQRLTGRGVNVIHIFKILLVFRIFQPDLKVRRHGHSGTLSASFKYRSDYQRPLYCHAPWCIVCGHRRAWIRPRSATLPVKKSFVPKPSIASIRPVTDNASPCSFSDRRIRTSDMKPIPILKMDYHDNNWYVAAQSRIFKYPLPGCKASVITALLPI